VGIFIDGTVLDDVLAAVADVHHLTEATVEEENLDVERPTLHVLIETVQIRIMFNLLIMRLPIEMLGEKAREGRLSRTNIACYCDVHIAMFLRVKRSC
jgi:hypothetical protein